MSIADDTGQDKFLFDEPARAALRQEILAAITGDVPFIVLTGPSGAGKTTLISRLTARLPGNIKDIFISQATGDDRRFEDVLLRVCQRIAPEISWDSHPNAQEVQRIQEQIRNYLIEKNIRILLIIDQAEQAFLAMLERVRKMLDTVNDGAVRMQLLLVGKEILLTNIEPLCLVQFEDIDERYFTLPLLTEDSPAQSGQPAARKILTAFSAAKLGRRLKNALPAPPRLPTSPRKHPAKQEPLPPPPATERKLATRGLVNLATSGGQTAAAISRAFIHGAAGLSALITRAAGAVFRGLGAGSHGIGRGICNVIKLIGRMLAALGRGIVSGLTLSIRLLTRAVSTIFHGVGALLRGIGRGLWNAIKLIGRILATVGRALVSGITISIRLIARALMAIGRALGRGAASLIKLLARTSLATGTVLFGAARGISKLGKLIANALIATGHTLTRLPWIKIWWAVTPSARVLKKAALAVAALCLAAGAGAALWYGVSRPPRPDVDRQDKPPLTATTTSPSATTADGEIIISPERGAAGKEPISTQPPAKTVAAPASKPTTQPPPKPTPIPPESVRPEVVEITADKVKKKREPETEPAPKPIHITRSVVVEKAKPQPTVVAKPEPAKTEEAAKTGKVTTPQVEKTETSKDSGAYSAGLSAGKRWTSGKNSGQYTVQVLTTSAKEAQTLVGSLPAQHANRVSIVSTGTDRVTIFYGNYPSMTEARQARGTLPAALRRGNPYAISVDGAMGRLKAR